jgi:hypothetical protein
MTGEVDRLALGIVVLVRVDGGSTAGPTKNGVMDFDKALMRVSAATGSCRGNISAKPLVSYKPYHLVSCAYDDMSYVIEHVSPSLDHWNNKR